MAQQEQKHWYQRFVGSRIKEAREAARLKQDDLVAELGVSRTILSRYENGQAEAPLRHLEIIAARTGVELPWLMGVEGPEWEGGLASIFGPEEVAARRVAYGKTVQAFLAVLDADNEPVTDYDPVKYLVSQLKQGRYDGLEAGDFRFLQVLFHADPELSVSHAMLHLRTVRETRRTRYLVARMLNPPAYAPDRYDEMASQVEEEQEQ